MSTDRDENWERRDALELSLGTRLDEAESILTGLLACFNDRGGAPLTRHISDFFGGGEYLSPAGVTVPSEIAERAARWLGRPISVVDDRKEQHDGSDKP